MFSYNTAVSSSTGFSPHELVYGRKAVIPSEFANEQVLVTFNQKFNDLFQKITETQALAVQNLEMAKLRCKYYYDRHIHPRRFNVGDLVYHLVDKRKTKFDPHWKGPYEVI